MAENEKPKTIFYALSQALKGNDKDVVKDLQKDDSGVLTGTQNPYDNDQYLQNQQQRFLDHQAFKVSQDLNTRYTYYDSDRISAYSDFRAMDLSPEISAALDIMSDECVTRNDKGEILTILSKNKRIKKVLEDLFYRVLNVNSNLWYWIRELLKYGDNFLWLQLDQHIGVYNIKQLPVGELHKEIAYDGNPDSIRFKWDNNSTYFEDFQIAHFSLVTDGSKLPYGRSILDSARKIWKQLQLATDAMLVYRLTRAPERRMFFIDVGNLNDTDVRQYIEKVKAELKKNPVVDQRTNNINFKFNQITFEEDYFIPMRGSQSATRIETLPGASNLDAIMDIEFLQNKLFTAIKVPKTYLNYIDALPGGSTLSQADLRFSRTINRFQESVILELRNIANIHLKFLGFDDDLNNFTLTLTNPSTQQELLKLETMKARSDVFKEMFSSDATAPVSYSWAMENIYGFSQEEIMEILNEKKFERKMFYEIERAHLEYQDTGVFRELDKKFRKPDFDPDAEINPDGEGDSGSDGGDSSFGGGSSFGMDDLGGLGAGGTDSGSPEDNFDPGGETDSPDTAALEPIGGDSEEEEAPDDNLKENKNKLLSKNRVFDHKSKTILENIDKFLNKIRKNDDEQSGTSIL